MEIAAATGISGVAVGGGSNYRLGSEVMGDGGLKESGVVCIDGTGKVFDLMSNYTFDFVEDFILGT